MSGTKETIVDSQLTPEGYNTAFDSDNALNSLYQQIYDQYYPRKVIENLETGAMIEADAFKSLVNKEIQQLGWKGKDEFKKEFQDMLRNGIPDEYQDNVDNFINRFLKYAREIQNPQNRQLSEVIKIAVLSVGMVYLFSNK